MSEIDLSIADLLADPVMAVARARTHGQVVRGEIGPFVLGHEALRGMLQDRRMTPSFPDVLRRFGVDSGPFFEFMARSPLNRDGEPHRAWRQTMVKTFTPRNVDELRPFLEAQSDALVAAFADAGECEFMGQYARLLPSLGLCELIGVPPDDRALFCEWADTMGLGFNPVFIAPRIADVDEALVKLRDYMRDLVRARQVAPKDDLVSRLALAVADPKDDFTEEDAAGAVAGLVFAGHETTKNQLGWMMVVLAEAPQEWERVASDPSRAHDVVEEVLRLRSAVANLGRTVAEDAAVAGVPLTKGTRVTASVWGANRDPAVFPDPDRVNVAANRLQPQLAFGQGPHHCLGAALARAELQVSLVTLTRHLHCPVVEEGAEYLPPIGITGPTRLPIRFDRRAQPKVESHRTSHPVPET